MGKIFTKIVVLLFTTICAILFHQIEGACFLLLIYLVGGFFREYQGKTKPPVIVGVFHNALALIVAFMLTIFVSIELWINYDFALQIFFGISLGIFYFFGVKNYFYRCIAWIPFSFCWNIIILRGISSSSTGAIIGDVFIFSLLFIAIQLFDLIVELLEEIKKERSGC